MEAIIKAFFSALNAILALFGKEEIVVDEKYGDAVKNWWEELQK